MERPRLSSLALWFACWAGLQVLLIAVPTWLRAHHFAFSNYDLGIYSQALARLALDPPNPWLSGRQLFLFNDHFDPILFVVAPFTRWFPAVNVGLVMEALCAALALLPLAWLRWEGRLSSDGLWFLGPLLALNVGVSQALGFPFHPTTWAMAPLAWLLAALTLSRWKTALFALVLLFTFKEEFPFVGLALFPYVFRRGPRPLAWVWLVLSVGWAVFVFVLRPKLFGEVMPYAEVPFRGADEGVVAFITSRLSPGVLAGAGDLFVAFLPTLAWLEWTRRKAKQPLADQPKWLGLVLVPMLGIRLLAMAWRDHYGAVATTAVVFLVAGWMAKRLVPPRWVVVATVALLLLTNESLLRRSVKSLRGEQGWGASSGCVDPVGRREALVRAIELTKAAPGPVFVSGNLLPWLAARDDVYAFGGPQGTKVVPNSLVLERPPCGDTWAQSLEQREVQWRAALLFGRVIVEDEFVLVVTR